MSRKRKRIASASDESRHARPLKKTKSGDDEKLSSAPTRHHTLALFYSHISTLRQFLLGKLPKSSKSRRRRLATAGLDLNLDDCNDQSVRLAELLDGTLVCTNVSRAVATVEDRARDLETFSKQVSLTAGSNMSGGMSSQSDLVDIAIWMLFNRVYRQTHKPPHMLCHGYQRAQAPTAAVKEYSPWAGIPGIVAHYPNSNVNVLKGPDWAYTMSFLGGEREQVVLDMILSCGIFVACSQRNGNYFQLSGKLAFSSLIGVDNSRNAIA